MKVSNLYVRYKGEEFFALEDVSFSAKTGELVLIAGPSGSGKTTLARIIAGLIPHLYPAEVKGEVDIMGINPITQGISKLTGIVGFVSQTPEMFTTSIVVIEELAMSLINRGVPRDEIIEKVMRVAKWLGIEDLLNRSTFELSSGQMQKVTLASVLVDDPLVLVLDEPLARLDKKSCLEVARILRELANNGKLVLVFEHHLDEILPLADRVIVLNKGRIIANAKPRDVVKLLYNIDIPEISEAFLLAKEDFIPLTVDEAEKYVRSIKRRMV